MLNYKAIDVFTSEEARYQNKPLSISVVQFVHDLKIAARCMVTRGIAGCYEGGEITTRAMEILSYNLPIRIYIIVPEAETERVLAGLNSIVNDGIIVVHDIQVVAHRARNSFLPRHLKVRDAMTPEPTSIGIYSSVGDAARLLLSSVFTGVPVVNERKRPVGIITQGDLISRGGMPLRLGLLAESEKSQVDEVFKQLDKHQAKEMMTAPVFTIDADQSLDNAVNQMLEKGVKRFPVVDSNGALIGMLSRLDIFRTVMGQSPDWSLFRAQEVEVTPLRSVKDIIRRDTQTVPPHATITEVIDVIDQNDIQRVAVVDPEGKLLGIISDHDLLRYFKHEEAGIWGALSKVKHALQEGTIHWHQTVTDTKAAEVMRTDLVTVREDQLIEEAIGLMADKTLKRLPVVDANGRFTGMISRDSLLRTGYECRS